MRRWMPLLGLAVVPMSGTLADADQPARAAHAASAKRQAQFIVSAYVAPRVQLDSSRAPAAFTLEAADLARGYKDVEARYRLTSNVTRGYMLRFAVRDGLAREIEVRGLGAPMSIGRLGGEMWQGGSAARGGELALTYRLHVDSRLAPGRYPLPVALFADALGPG